jgi:cytochrome P450
VSRATATPTGDLVFDPYDYALQDDPYPVYRRLRDEEPLHHNEEHDFWVLSRHADIHAAVRTDGVFSHAMGVSLDASAWSRHAHRTMSFLAMDPPQQTRLRKLVSRGFTPGRVAGLEPQIQRIVETHLDALDGREELDWIGEVAGRVPMDVISEMLGVPLADRDEVRRLADLLVHREHGLRDVPTAGVEAALSLFDYYADLLAEKRRRPCDDLTSALLAVNDGGDRMTDEEIIAFLFLMVVAGNETTTKLLGNAVYHLTDHPGQRDDVFADPGPGHASTTGDPPGLVERWVEETLRHDTSTQMLARHLVADLTLHGVSAPQGAKLLLCLGAANRDDRVFSDPDTFDVHRDEAELRRLISFGGGRHFCLGANLARLESRVVLRETVRRYRTIEAEHAGAVRFYSANVRGFARLPVRVEARR